MRLTVTFTSRLSFARSFERLSSCVAVSFRMPADRTAKATRKRVASMAGPPWQLACSISIVLQFAKGSRVNSMVSFDWRVSKLEVQHTWSLLSRGEATHGGPT